MEALRPLKFLRFKKRAENPISVFSIPLDDPSNTYYRNLTALTGYGGWRMLFKEQKLFLDAQARKLLGIPHSYTPMMRNAFDFFAKQQEDTLELLYNTCLSGETIETEIQITTVSGDLLWTSLVAEPIFGKRKDVIGIAGAFRDIDQAKQKSFLRQQQLNIHRQRENQLKEYTSIFSRKLHESVSNLEHTSALLNDTPLNPNQEELNGAIKELTERLVLHVDHFKKLADIQTKRVVSPKKVALDRLLKRVKEGLRTDLIAHHVKIYSEFSEVPYIDTIAQLLEEVLLELTRNAIQFRHPDRELHIDICTVDEEDEYLLIFRDNGIGFDVERHQKRVFQPYQTFHPERSGNGMGLYLLKNSVEALGARIELDSVPDRKTRVVIAFPKRKLNKKQTQKKNL
ncbi:ATP-binding protein [Croceiramulus getboli]|nr:HAMP domain-containing sensor histidine kinase [Flavobacteriaceae bacterium YJPT1-3]